jgi:DNA-binding transcriptional ArsR family regulator
LTKISKAQQELKDFDLVFKALAHPSRRLILTVLLMENGKLNAGDIVEHFQFKWPTITRHLKQLEEAGLIESAKDGTQNIYTLNSERMKLVLNNWLKWF